jgi:hypothetical protein
VTLADLAIVKHQPEAKLKNFPQKCFFCAHFYGMEMCGNVWKGVRKSVLWAVWVKFRMSSQLASSMTICRISSEAKIEGWRAQQLFMQKQELHL